jgi:transcriptional regulator with XRE-family HTH domain
VKKKTPRKYFKDEKFLKQIGENIRSIRLDKEITQEALANECEIDYSQINRMELGKVNFSISYLNKIAAALKTDPKDLLP